MTFIIDLLLSGPYLTNQSIIELHRFRLELGAFMAIIHHAHGSNVRSEYFNVKAHAVTKS